MVKENYRTQILANLLIRNKKTATALYEIQSKKDDKIYNNSYL